LLCSRAGAAPRPNGLFIAVDDLNHRVGHPGRSRQTKTPHLDRLARMGVTFTNARCAAPVDFMSLYPTLCDLAGIDRPARVEARCGRLLAAAPVNSPRKNP
jgi:arylsulfatase A-like enzyme